MNLDRYLLNTMFEKSLFSDLSLAFYHESFPFTMRFDVHKAIIAQSPFFRLLLENTHRLATVETDSTDYTMDSQQSNASSSPSNNGALHLTIDLIQAMTRCGFIMAPLQHIIRRQWQRQAAPLNETPTSSSSSSSSSQDNNGDNNHQTRHILSSHLRFALKWMYSVDRTSMVDTLQDEDTLRVLCVSVLFGLDTLVDDCLERYTTHQLSIDAITDDLETICQLPRDHKAYQQLRDAALLLLLRLGPQYPRHLARLPVDYMSDVLSVDLLYIGCEYERYCLLREVLVAYMQSVGKITWTPNGPVDQDFKRLSGFVQNMGLQQQKQQQQHNLSASDVRSSKRKRIPSEELDMMGSGSGEQQASDGDHTSTKLRRLTRLSFSACVPFEKLVADASSGGVIDKATILSYLLRTTVNYSNMTFDQLAIVRQDGIVDESIVFRALWQREELERLLFPFNYQQSQPLSTASTAPATTISLSTVNKSATMIPRFGKKGDNNNGKVGGGMDAMDRRAALDEYFDVGDADGKGKRRRMLLGTPRFRFSASASVVLPGACSHGSNNNNNNDDDIEDDGWDLEELTDTSDNEPAATTAPSTPQKPPATTTDNDDDHANVFDDDDDDNSSIWVCEDDKDTLDGKHTTTTSATPKKSQYMLDRLMIGETRTIQDKQQQKPTLPHWVFKKTIYSEAEYILGHWHRVRLEMQLIPRSLVFGLHEKGRQSNNNNKKRGGGDQGEEDEVLVCRFELQRDYHSSTTSSQQSTQNNHSSNASQQQQQQQQQSSSSTNHLDGHRSSRQQTKIRYDIYCLNRHQVLGDGDNHVDPEDKVLIPVSKVTESNDAAERSAGYVKQVVLNLDDSRKIEVDMVVALEIFGFQKT